LTGLRAASAAGAEVQETKSFAQVKGDRHGAYQAYLPWLCRAVEERHAPAGREEN
jgi:hypothetical protein